MITKTEFITDEEIYKRVILEAVSSAKEFLWLGTSDLKKKGTGRRTGAVPIFLDN